VSETSGVAPAAVAAGSVGKPARAGRSSLLRHARHVLGENPVTLVSLLFFCLLLLIALFGNAVVPYNPLASNTQDALQAPSRHHWFGTDQLGRDIFSRVLAAVRLDLAMAVGAVGLSFVVGSVAGACAGFYRGWTDRIVGRVVDTIMAFPLFVLAMAIVAALGNNVSNIVYATAIINLPFYARLGRAEISVLRESGMVEAARLSGNSRASILFRHLYPNIIPPMVVQISLNMGWAMLNAAGLSFIGLGVRPPTAEWGIMVSDGANFIVSGEWWIALFPGFALMAAVLCFNLLGDGLRDIVDPRRRT
jgi:peptide/nickel transport system permease protein